MAKFAALHAVHVFKNNKNNKGDLLPQHQKPDQRSSHASEEETDGQLFTKSFYHSGNHPYADDHGDCLAI